MIEALELARVVLAKVATSPDWPEHEKAHGAYVAVTNALNDIPAVVKLSGLGLAVVACRDGGVDGFELQDMAEAAGVLVRVTVDKPCGEHCACAEFGDFPQDCFRLESGVAALLAAKRAQEGA